jgi:hypothetical protein
MHNAAEKRDSRSTAKEKTQSVKLRSARDCWSISIFPCQNKLQRSANIFPNLSKAQLTVEVGKFLR